MRQLGERKVPRIGSKERIFCKMQFYTKVFHAECAIFSATKGPLLQARLLHNCNITVQKVS